MLIEYVPTKRYMFRQYVNRVMIAEVLGRQALVPYDIRMLHQLGDLCLVEESKHPLPRKRYGDILLGAGAEFVYTIPLDTLYGLLYYDPDERPRLQTIGARPAVPLTSAPNQALKSPQTPDDQSSVADLLFLPPVRHRSRLDGLLDRISDQNLKRLFRMKE